MDPDLRSLFMLDPDTIFLNHGSFGACPRPVFEHFLELQRDLETSPMDFLVRRGTAALAAARSALAGYLGCSAKDLVYFPNPTTAINMVARSLRLGPGDEILSTDHEYGAMDLTWRFICEKSGARYRRQPIALPLESEEQFIESFWTGFNRRTRVIFLSHITSPTALRFPVERICQMARAEGVLTIIDGAHAPGQIDLNLQAMEPDLYTGACHKWLCAPKGSAFLYARPDIQGMLEPLVVSWGWGAEKPAESTFIDYHEWQGTRDISAFLAVPAAIAFQEQHRWPQVRQECHRLARLTRQRLHNLTGLEPLCPDSSEWFVQMFASPLPDVPVEDLMQHLYQEHRIEIIAHRWNDRAIMRVSIQGYNTPADCDALMMALPEAFRRVAG